MEKKIRKREIFLQILNIQTERMNKVEKIIIKGEQKIAKKK